MSEIDCVDWNIYNQIFINSKIELHVGGSALNTIRMTNCILSLFKTDMITYFFGSTSNDKFGELVVNRLQIEKISFLNQLIDKSVTCSNIVLVENKERTFFTNLGVSDKIKLEFLKENRSLFEELKLFYTDAYLIYRCKEIYNFVYKIFYTRDDLLLVLGMGSYIAVDEYFNLINEILPFVDIIVINKEENQSLKKHYGKDELTSDEDFLRFLSESNKANRNKQRIIVNTRGSLDTIICIKDFGNNKCVVHFVPVETIDPNDIVDYSGAGDAFTGGFLAGLLNNLKYEDCTKLGNLVASEIIKLRGFQIPTNTTKIEIFIKKIKM